MVSPVQQDIARRYSAEPSASAASCSISAGVTAGLRRNRVSRISPARSPAQTAHPQLPPGPTPPNGPEDRPPFFQAAVAKPPPAAHPSRPLPGEYPRQNRHRHPLQLRCVNAGSRKQGGRVAFGVSRRSGRGRPRLAVMPVLQPLIRPLTRRQGHLLPQGEKDLHGALVWTLADWRSLGYAKIWNSRRKQVSKLKVKPSEGEGRVSHVTPESAGWTYVGFDLHRLKPGDTSRPRPVTARSAWSSSPARARSRPAARIRLARRPHDRRSTASRGRSMCRKDRTGR